MKIQIFYFFGFKIYQFKSIRKNQNLRKNKSIQILNIDLVRIEYLNFRYVVRPNKKIAFGL